MERKIMRIYNAKKHALVIFFLGEEKFDRIFKRILIEVGNKEGISFAEIF